MTLLFQISLVRHLGRELDLPTLNILSIAMSCRRLRTTPFLGQRSARLGDQRCQSQVWHRRPLITTWQPWKRLVSASSQTALRARWEPILSLLLPVSHNVRAF